MTSNSQSLGLGPIVTVEKRYGRKVGLAIVDENRQFTHGFETDFPAPMHFRILRYGAFSVMVLADLPVEVRIMMDGQLLAEQRLDPLPQPGLHAAQDRSAVRKQVRELVRAPQPFFISFADDNAPLVFKPDPLERSSQELLHLQLYPRTVQPGQRITMQMGDAPIATHDAVVDIAPKLLMPAQVPQPPSEDAQGISATASTANGISASDTTGTSIDFANPNEEAALAASAPATIVDANGVVAPSDYAIEAPLLQNWAPSFGLIAVGVRMIQVQTVGEPSMPPDGFDYVLFQCNTFERNALVRANLHSRVKVPPKIAYSEIDDGTTPSHNHTEFGHQGCGNSLHGPRHFH